MAEKRMFSKKITDSDAFTEMSNSTQCLYFHLNQGADDDGFNNQIKVAMLKAHATTDDLKILMAKNFIIRFDNGVIVIKHWRMHNTLRKDRYTPTNFQEELKMLGIKENGSYTLDLSEDVNYINVESNKNISDSRAKRIEARKKSDLPYSFDYKIKHAFIGEICPVCGVKMGVAEREEDESVIFSNPSPSIQHNIPISKGGEHDINNISVICAKCNYSLQDKITGDLNNELVKEKWMKICGVSGLATQNRLDKISKDKNNIDYYTNNLLSENEPEIVEKISEKEEIFNFWNEKNIIKHRNLTKEIEKALEKALKNLNKDIIIECIDRYSKVLSDNSFYFDYKWSLTDFLNRKNGISSFTDEGSMWVSYITIKNKNNQITNENVDNISKQLEERINARKGNYGI